MLSLALIDWLITVLRLSLPLSLALVLLDSCAEALSDAEAETLSLRDWFSEFLWETLLLTLVEASLREVLLDAMLSLSDADVERLSDLLVLALSDSLARLRLWEADSDAALSDCDNISDRLCDADLLALSDSEASIEALAEALASLAMLLEALSLAR